MSGLLNDIILFIKKIFESGDWPQRWKCGQWTAFHGWLYILSDLAIGLAYFTIPAIILYYIKKNSFTKFNNVFILFAIFIFACGCTHLIDAYIFWDPIYRVSAVARFFTAIISWTTILYLFRFIPEFVQLKSPITLNREIEQRKRSEAELNEIKISLEDKVKSRTKTLEETNRKLQEEINLRSKNELIIKESEEKFKSLVESSPNAILLTNKIGSIQLINVQAEELFGYKRQELLGKSIENLLPEDYRESHPENRHSFFNHPVKRPMGMGRDLYALHKNGYKIPVEIGLTPIQDKGNLMVLSTIVDITERKRVEEKITQKNMELEMSNMELQEKTAQLIQSEKMSALGVLVSGVAHEINNPLTGILTFTQYCQKNVEQGSKVYKVLDDIMFEAMRCEKIIKNLLTYAHYHSDDQVLTTEDMGSMVARIFNLFQNILEDIEVVTDFEENYPAFQINPNKFQQVLMNLIKNAVDAMDDNQSGKKTLKIASSYDQNFCYITISDNGKGINPENRLKIFDPFFTDKEVGKGTGLGLSVTKSIMDECKGEIMFESEKNKGTTFKLKFIQEKK